MSKTASVANKMPQKHPNEKQGEKHKSPASGESDDNSFKRCLVRPSIYPHPPRKILGYADTPLTGSADIAKNASGLVSLRHLVILTILITMAREIAHNVNKQGLGIIGSLQSFKCFCVELSLWIVIFASEVALNIVLFAIHKLFATRRISRLTCNVLYCLLQAVYLLAPFCIFPPMNPYFKCITMVTHVVTVMKMHSYHATNMLLAKERSDTLWTNSSQGKAATGESDLVKKKLLQNIVKTNKEDNQDLVKRNTRCSSTSDEGSQNDTTYEISPELCYPESVNISNFYYFIGGAATLIYETNYERTPKIRWGYALKQLIGSAICFTLLTILFDLIIVPEIMSQDKPNTLMNHIKILGNISIPALSLWFLGFSSLFHFFVNFASEVMRFGDRRLYEDWWNANSMEEFWKKWNMPVHEWCLRHVYVEAGYYFKVSKQTSLICVFIFSALMHEYQFSPAFGGFKGYFLLGMLLQIPLIILHRAIGKINSLGNMSVWIILLIILPFLEVLYFKEWRETITNNYSFWCVNYGSCV